MTPAIFFITKAETNVQLTSEFERRALVYSGNEPEIDHYESTMENDLTNLKSNCCQQLIK